VQNVIGASGDDSYVKLLMHFNGADGADATVDSSSEGATVSRVNTPVLDDAQKKFGATSGLFAAGDQWTVPDSDNWNFGAGDFTIDFWVRFASVGTTNKGLIGQKNEGDSYTPIYIFLQDDNHLGIYTSTSGSSWSHQLTSTATFSADTWYHVAVVVASGTLKAYINGALDITQGSLGTLYNGAGTMKIGNMIHANFAGWIDEIRISKGVARWTADFSSALPSAEYFNSKITLTPASGKQIKKYTTAVDKSLILSELGQYIKLRADSNGDWWPVGLIGSTPAEQ
jgi:hypothetical protein